MKKVFIATALAAMIVSCGSKGNKSAEIIAESESDSIFAVNDSTLSELQTYSYEGILPAADAEGINYQLTLPGGRPRLIGHVQSDDHLFRNKRW
ncbi:copper resistance protein NlpE [Phocaeicola vulgatus]|nr:copper resistance protein NlpE [Phocaeicola vulgatus]